MKRSIAWIEQTVAALWARIERSCATNEESLAWFRILWGLYALLFVAPYVSWVGRVPPGFFAPPLLSLASLFDGFPAGPVMVAIELVVLTAVLAITVGFHTRVATVVFVVGHTFLYSFQYSFGKIDHEIMLVATTLCLGFTNWGTRWAVRPDRRWSADVTNRALAVAGVLVAFGMFTAGHEKLFRWVDFDSQTSGFLAWFYSGYLMLGRTYLAAPWVVQIPPTAFELLDYASVAFELSAMIALVIGPRSWRMWLLVACVFHLGNTVLLNIPFLVHVPVYLLFVRWSPALMTRVGHWLEAARPRLLLLLLVPLGLWLAHVALRLGGSGSRFLFIDDRTVEMPARLYAGVVLWLICSVVLAGELWRRRSEARGARSPGRPSPLVPAAEEAAG